MVEQISLAAQPRDGSVKARALRRSAIVPGVMYGRDSASQSLQFDYRTLARAIQQAGTSHFISLQVGGDEKPSIVLIREVQLDPVTDRINHVDLYKIVGGVEIRITVPLVQSGETLLTETGGVVNQVLFTLEIECLPKDMPGSIDVDLSKLVDFDSSITIADLDIPDNVKALEPLDQEVVRVIIPRMVFEEEVEAEVEAEVEGEAGAEEAAGEEGAEAGEEQEES